MPVLQRNQPAVQHTEKNIKSGTFFTETIKMIPSHSSAPSGQLHCTHWQVAEGLHIFVCRTAMSWQSWTGNPHFHKIFQHENFQGLYPSVDFDVYGIRIDVVAAIINAWLYLLSNKEAGSCDTVLTHLASITSKFTFFFNTSAAVLKTSQLSLLQLLSSINARLGFSKFYLTECNIGRHCHTL